MDMTLTPTTWFSIVAIGLAIGLIFVLTTYSIFQWIVLRCTRVFLKHIVYSKIGSFGLSRHQPSIRDTILALIYMSTNGICIGWGMHSAQELSTRCASLLATNLILLLPSASLAADLLRISLRSYHKAHFIIGLVALIEGSIHSMIELFSRNWSSNTVTVSGTAAFSCLTVMCITSLPIFRNRIYEISRTIHFGCATLICVSIWLHVYNADRLAKIQAILGACMWIATYAHRNLLFIYRNFSMSRPRTTALVENIHNSTLIVAVDLPRPWKIKPGQYIYLTVASTGIFSIFQRHPFMVMDSEKHDFELRIQPNNGFTKRLLERTLGKVTRINAFIEGPYGHGFNLQKYGTVVLFASSIGIAGHIPYIQELVQDYQRSRTKTRDVLLIWHVESKDQLDLVERVMSNLLRRDDIPTDLRQDNRGHKEGRRLRVSSTPDRPGVRPAPHGENILDVYVYGDYELRDSDGHSGLQKREGSRIAEIRGEPNISQIIHDVLDTRRGEVAICVCGNRQMRDIAREAVAQNIKRDVRYLECDFQPFEPTNHTKRRRSLSIECRGIAQA